MTSRPEDDNPFRVCATATATAAKHATRLALAYCRENPGGSVCAEFFRAIAGRLPPPCGDAAEREEERSPGRSP
ncbi:MAG: hypothetical protein LBP61_04565 [Desulfovibrio sp.]|nr:hypothetical protein [Desulfovibrio sp.]